MYSLGVIAYLLLMGEYPVGPITKQIQEPLHSLLVQMMEPDPNKRITMLELNTHVLIKDVSNIQ